MKTSPNVEKWLKEGRGSGIGDDYKPWLLSTNVQTRGRNWRLKRPGGQRLLHLFSDLEYKVALILLMARRVIDLREQFPLLPREETIDIAYECGINHPLYPNKTPIVLTTDVLITVADAMGNKVDIARTVKYRKDLTERTLEKFEIERRYWASRGVDWGIITEADVSDVAVKNIAMVHPHKDLSNQGLSPEFQTAIRELLVEAYPASGRPLNAVAKDIDERLGLKPGSTLPVFFNMLATHQWQVDWEQPIRPWTHVPVVIPTEGVR